MVRTLLGKVIPRERLLINRAVLVAAAVFATVGAARTLPLVTDVVMTQQTGTRIVKITYNLADEAAIVTLGIETNGVAIPDSAVTRLSGDVCKLVNIGENKSIVWNAGADWPENLTQVAKARVTAWSVDAPPQVMVIDLTGGDSAANYPVTYYVSVEALPYGGVTNSIYKNSQLVMRKIPSGAFTMGEGTGSKQVILTTDFYVGVFQVTQGQWYNVMGSTRAAYFTDVASKMFRPMEQVSYHDIRENPATNTPINPNWPQFNEVGPASFMGRLRTKAGLSGFDLPTEAQWEYACRAGTDTCFNDDDADANVIGANGTGINAWLDALGRYKFNGGYIDGSTPPAAGCGPTYGTAIVGSYAPNDWDLYDMHGNVWEWCLDWYGSALGDVTVDPKGVVSGSNRTLRGGCWNSAASSCRSAHRNSDLPSALNSSRGFRLVRILP